MMPLLNRRSRSGTVHPASDGDMRDKDLRPSPVQDRGGWHRLVIARWPLFAAGIAVLVLIGDWALAHRGSTAPAADSAVAAGKATRAGPDSIVKLDSTALRLAGVEIDTVTLAGSGALVANGTITYDANRVSVVGPRVEGRVVAVRADLGEQVRAGTVLAILESPGVGQTRGEMERARANLEVARRNYEREERLFSEQISSQKELLEAEGTYRSAQAEYNSALAQLKAVGAAAGEGPTFGLRTPVSGTVVERNASPGQIVGPSANLFTVADLRHVWITVDVYERDLARVKRGAEAGVTPTALPSALFKGLVTYAGGIVDSVSRTFKVRVELENPDQRLRPGMFARVRIQAPALPGTEGALTVPEVAVQEVEGKQVVFVVGPAPGEFVARRVTLAPGAGGGVAVVTSGLSAGERIVTKGAFQLKAELTKASFGQEE